MSAVPRIVGEAGAWGSRPRLEGLPSVSVVIPTLNEAANLGAVLQRMPTWVSQVILVDGHSTDGTVQLARRLMPDIEVLYQTGRGKGDALAAGFAAARGDVVAAIDADGSMNPDELLAYVGLLVAGADLVKGSRFIQGGGTTDMSLIRRVGNWVLLHLVRLLFGSRYSDLCYGYFAFWRDVLPELHPDVDGFEIETLINVRALEHGLKVAEVPSFEANRLSGASHLHAVRDGLRILRTIGREWLAMRNDAAHRARDATR
jgi:glycosyltransferase involved in cell wall biosynthesis